MARMEQQIVRQAEVRKLRKASLKLGTEHELIVGLILHHVAHANKLLVRSKPLKLIPRQRRIQIDPAHHALDEAVLLGEFEEPDRLFEALTSLHSDRSAEAVFIKEGLQIPRKKIPLQRCHLVVNPPVLCDRVLPEMLM